MASPATAETSWRGVTLLAVVIATSLAWLGVVPIMSSADAQLCGVDLQPFALVALWTLMSVTMMLPVALPLVVRRSVGKACVFLAGYLTVTAGPSRGAGGLEMWLRVNGAMTGGVPPPATQAVLAVLAVASLLGSRVRPAEACRSGMEAGRSHFGICTATAALQLAFGSMRPEMMLALTLWMLAMTTSPFGRRKPDGPIARCLSRR